MHRICVESVYTMEERIKGSFEEHWFRGSAALRLGGKFYRGEWGVWLEIAGILRGLKNAVPIAGKARYDWNGKIALHLSADDLGKLGWALSSGRKGSILTLHHRFHQKKKMLQLVIDEKGTLFLNAHEESINPSGRTGEKMSRALSVPLSEDGIWKFKQCIALAYQETVCHAVYESVEQKG